MKIKDFFRVYRAKAQRRRGAKFQRMNKIYHRVTRSYARSFTEREEGGLNLLTQTRNAKKGCPFSGQPFA